jgi:hypothetical protein
MRRELLALQKQRLSFGVRDQAMRFLLGGCPYFLGMPVRHRDHFIGSILVTART